MSAAGSGTAVAKSLKRQGTVKRIYGVVPPSELEKPYDLVVIGGGPAGVAAAEKAAFLGRRAIIVDDSSCAPTELDLAFGAPTGLFSKALRDTAKTVDVDLLSKMGMDKKVVWLQVQASIANLASNNAKTVLGMLEEFKIGYLRGRAKLESCSGEGEAAVTTLEVTQRDGTTHKLSTARVLVATGSTPTRPDSVPFDDQQVFDSDSIANLAFLPKRVVIQGAGIIGIEYAKIFAKLKAQVCVLIRGDAASSLARLFDPQIVQGLLDDLVESGVTVYAHTTIDGFDVPPEYDAESPSPIGLRLKGKEGSGVPASIECDLFLAAMGRRPTSANLGLEELGGTVDAKSGAVKVDEDFHVSGAPPSIFAAGDVIGPPALASTSVEQAKAAVATAFSEGSDDKAHVGKDNFPVGVWTIPEIAYYGYSKDAAIAKGFDADEGTAPYTACLRGRVFAPQGFVKLVFDRVDGRVIGVHIMGSDACELIHFGMELVNGKRTIFDVMSMLFTAVTFHELFKFAAFNANSKLAFGLQWRSILKELSEVVKKDDLDSLRAKFDELDADKSGELDFEELTAVFKGLGKDVSVGTLTNMLRLADKDGSGSISFEEFAEIIAAL